jgi:hypothetical protein
MNPMSTIAPSSVDAKLVTKFVVYLRTPGLWLGDGPNPRWVERKDQAQRFSTFGEADTASEGYDVIIKTVEEESR